MTLRASLRGRLIIIGFDRVMFDATVVTRHSLVDLFTVNGVVFDESDPEVRAAFGERRGKLHADTLPSALRGVAPFSELRRTKERLGAAIWNEMPHDRLRVHRGSRQLAESARHGAGGMVFSSSSGTEVTQASRRRLTHSNLPVVGRPDDDDGSITSTSERLLELAEKRGASPQDCIVIKASERAVTAALRAGMQVVRVGAPQSASESPRLPVVRGIDEIEIERNPTSGVFTLSYPQQDLVRVDVPETSSRGDFGIL